MRNLLVALALSLCGACAARVNPGQAGLMYRAIRTPALKNEVLPPGRYKVWGFKDLIVYDVTSQNKNEEVAALTADTLHVPVTVTVSYHPRKDQIYKLHTEIGPDYYTKILGPAFITLVRAEISRHMHNDLAKESPMIEQTVRDKLQAIANRHYIQIDQIAIRHIDYDDTVTASISHKIATRQKSEQKAYEVQIAERDAEIARTSAKGRADATRIQADGDAAAIIARGNAQAKAQEAIAKTLTPAYLQYKAFDNHAASFYFIPQGKDGLPIIVNTEKPPAQPSFAAPVASGQ
jgi:regulator of protease activity HflC (stomatin/prohibitin superfamily)